MLGKFNNYLKSRSRSWLGINDMNQDKKLEQIYSNEFLFEKRLHEFSVWYSGDVGKLRYYYKYFFSKQSLLTIDNTFYAYDDINFFWQKSTEKIRKIHTGIPQLICSTMATLLFSNGYEIHDKENEQSEVLEAILKENNFTQLLSTGAETESWAGFFAFKISLDTELSEYPILEVVQPENIEIREKRGRIYEILFLSYYTKNKKGYCLHECYGKGYITYSLYEESSKKDKEIPLTTLEETKDLVDITFDENIILAEYKPNKLPNSEFRGTLIGESDYSGLTGEFDALDEIISQWIEDIRKGRLTRYIPENLVPKDDKGRSKPFDDFVADYEIFQADLGEGKDNRIVSVQSDVDVDRYIKSYETILLAVLQKTGLSPSTIGVDPSGANASGQSIREREKSSLRTRGKKIELWKETINNIITKLLISNDILNNKKVAKYDITVNIKDYVKPTLEDRLKLAGDGIKNMTSDIKTAVKIVHDTKTDEEIDELVANIKSENGIGEVIENEEMFMTEDDN